MSFSRRSSSGQPAGWTVSRWLAGGILLAGTLASVAAAESQRPLRTWTDRSGQYAVLARLVDLRADQVVLSKADGAEISVPIEQLSVADQRAARLEMRRRSAGPERSGAPTVRLVGLDWYRGPAAAVNAARATSRIAAAGTPSDSAPAETRRQTLSSRADRPILWFRVLGDMQGFM